MILNNGLLDIGSCSILSPNRYENLDARDTNINTAIDSTNADYNRETVKNHVFKNKFYKNIEHNSPMETCCSKSTP